MIPAQIAIVVFVAILLYAFWRILAQRSGALRTAPAADHVLPAISTGPRKHADVRQLLAQMAEVLRTRLQLHGHRAGRCGTASLRK